MLNYIRPRIILIIFIIIIIPVLILKGIEYYNIIDPQTDTQFADFYYQYIAAKGALDRTTVLYDYMKHINEFHPYPPTTSFFYLPIIIFNYNVSSILFLILNYLIFLGIFFIVLRTFIINKINNIHIIVLLIILSFFQPIWLNFKAGQINLFLSFLIFIIFYLYHSKLKYKKYYVSFLIASGFLIKISPLFLLLYFFIIKDFKVIILTCLWIPLLIVFSLLFMSFNEYVYFYNYKLPQYTHDFWITRTLNCKSLYSFLIRIFGHPLEYNLLENLSAKLYYPKLIKPLNFLILLILFVIVTSYIRFKSMSFSKHILIYSQVVLLSQFIYKASWNYTYTNIMFTIAFLYFHIIEYKKIRYFIIFFIAYFLLNITFDFATVYYPNNYYLLLTAPQLYAKFILFFLTNHLIKKIC